MGKKLPPRFIPVDKYDRDSCRCESCDKIRATCTYYQKCYEHCDCHICDLCDGLTTDASCTCFYCPVCHNKTTEDHSCIDNYKYDNTGAFNPSEPHREICDTCYEKLEKQHKKQGFQNGKLPINQS
jgi:hypothetical protein